MTQFLGVDQLARGSHYEFNSPLSGGTADGWADNPFTDGSVPSGVYSGADIELIVHLPNEEVQWGLIELEEEQVFLQQTVDELERGPNSQRAAELTQIIQETTEDINERLSELEQNQGTTKVLAEIQTLSVSIHREKFPYRTLGSVHPRSVCRGPRTIAGSMVFTTFNEHVFQDLIDRCRFRSTGVGDWDQYEWTTMITDQLPPLDISIRFANEYGNLSWMGIFGVDFMNEGMVLSIEDLFLEGTIQYIARDIDLIRNVANREMTRTHGVGTNLTGSMLLQRDLNQRTRNRRNPFL